MPISWWTAPIMYVDRGRTHPSCCIGSHSSSSCIQSSGVLPKLKFQLSYVRWSLLEYRVSQATLMRWDPLQGNTTAKTKMLASQLSKSRRIIWEQRIQYSIKKLIYLFQTNIQSSIFKYIRLDLQQLTVTYKEHWLTIYIYIYIYI